MTSRAILHAISTRYPFEGDVLERDALPVLHICSLFLCIIGLGLLSDIVRLDVDGLKGLFASVGLLWAAGLVSQCIRLRAVGEALKIVAIFALLCLVAPLATAVLARISNPLADDVLAHVDRLLLFDLDWPAMVIGIDRHPLIIGILNYAYCSLNWQPVFLIFAFCLTNRTPRAWAMLQVFAGALAMCIVVFPFAPAVGGYIYFGISPETVPDVRVTVAWDAAKILYGLKDGTLTVLGTDALAGIVTMPSFHVASALILAWSAWTIPTLRWPLASINLLMIVSAVPVGGHYVVDTMAGAACALLSIGIFTFARTRSAAEAIAAPCHVYALKFLKRIHGIEKPGGMA